ncbi:hypothetical protein M378DRAFT_163885 [Amanita muscaria Koide BX008]|uniref:HNH nuclease domain-containing protein n=1 Tax=Amanita muscaria (strain Koide BX008) TaxID=946122 RepID=A0A0C2WQI3_AMAMK|nr:hypothetical protein M378DRAFT_163885 [Amanita muscaria Koide BX008]
MELSKVPNPQFPSTCDIVFYTLSNPKFTGGTIATEDANLRGSSLEGQRSIADFFELLDYVIISTTANDYKLQKVDDTLSPLTDPVERSSPGNIAAGNYLILPSDEGGRIVFENLSTFTNSNFKSMGINSPSMRAVKRVKRDGGGSTASEQSSRDPPDDSQSFKMRLVYRDKGCAVCLAAGTHAIYKYREDSNRYEGAHIIPFAYHNLWDANQFSALVKDPFTDPVNADSPFASPTTRTKKDSRRINSLDNGILLCLEHRKDYDNFRFSIHHETHKIFAFHPATAALQGVEVKAPWERPDVFYPPPLPTFLGKHFAASVANAMNASGDDYELDVDYEDYEDSELEEIL